MPLNRGRFASKILLLLVLVLFVACAGRQALPGPLVVVHLNDTHSHLESTALDLTIQKVKTTVEIGGFPRIKTVLDQMRSNHPDLLLLHAGDAVQGTPYFPRFKGLVEFEFLNQLGVDAMTFGNHEFDRGTEPIAGWIRLSQFPWLSANIDFSGEQAIAPLVQPFLIREIHGEKVGIIGLTTEDTPSIARDTGRAVFQDAFACTRSQVEKLTALGVHRIIVLSHLGYSQDMALASQVSGIDIIVGGHSHSLLVDRERVRGLGRLGPEGPYPTEVKAPDGKTVLVLQAWQWGHAIGMIRVRFSPEGM
jgi:5'-nucleotidase